MRATMNNIKRSRIQQRTRSIIQQGVAEVGVLKYKAHDGGKNPSFQLGLKT